MGLADDANGRPARWQRQVPARPAWPGRFSPRHGAFDPPAPGGYLVNELGEVAERLNAPVSKTGSLWA